MEQVRAVLVAGGPATRMRPLAACLPKALLPFGDTNLLALHLRALAEHGIRRATIIAGHLADRIAAELPILAPAGLKVEFVVEPHPVGSGGCLRYLPSEEGPLLIIFADLLASMDYRALLKHHQKNHLLATLVVHPNDHPADSDLVELGPEGAVVALHRKPRSGRLLYRNLACAGVFVLEQQALSCLPPAGSADLVHDCIGPLVERGAAVGAYRTTEYLKDCGIPERYQRALDDFARGQVNARARSVPRPTLFLDRDGTINRHIGHLHLPEQLELLPGAAAAIRRLNTAGALAIVVTNQPVIARGLCTLADLERIHAKLEMMLGEEGVFLDALYACPHHPDRGFPGEAVEFKVTCGCRKPKTGMIDAAVREWAIDLRRSAVVGDTERDIELARQAELPAFWLGSHGQEVPPGVTPVAGLSEAVDHFLAWIQDGSSSLMTASASEPSPATGGDRTRMFP